MKVQTEFEELAREAADRSFVSELWGLIRYKKKYWLTPIIVVLLLLGVLVFLSGTAAAPFIYTLF
jgi:Family of unknown function (DUF5989)